MIKVGRTTIEQNSFPDGTLRLQMPFSDDKLQHFSKDCVSVYWYYENDGEMFTLKSVKDYLDSYNIESKLIMPYVPNARQDRVKEIGDVFTLKSFTDFINNLNFKTVTVLDPHSSVSEALINNVRVERPVQYIQKAIDKVFNLTNEDPIAFYPDEGAMKRYSETNRLPYAFGVKNRDWKTGEIKGLHLVNGETVMNKHILIIDDICSKGGTFYHSAKALKTAGAKNICLYITHCEPTILEGEIFKSGLIERVYTTNTIFNEKAQKKAEEQVVANKMEVFKYEEN